MNDIGVVEYSKDIAKNCILAKWFYVKNNKTRFGTGIAIGKLSDNYEGEYIVTYYNQNGAESSKFNLCITKKQDHYELKWLADGKIEFLGIGMERGNKLFAGWRSTQDICA
jgi:hypothetical protein